MKFIEEIVVERFLPTARSLLAERLRDRGLTQEEIAAAIGVSQGAVSKYIHGDVARDPQVAADERVSDRVEEIAEAVADGAMEPIGVLIELEVLIRELEEPGKLLARLHAEAVPGLEQAAGIGRIHDPDTRIRLEEHVKGSVHRAIRRLERTPEFATLLPEVGSNVVEAVPDAKSIDDVVGIPGRIIDVEGAVEVPGNPAFGVSGHVARVLLAARDAGSPARAAVNLRYHQQDLEKLDDQGHRIREISGGRPVIEAVGEAVTADPTVDVLAQTGAVGVEPITYILAPDAPKAVSLASDLLE